MSDVRITDLTAGSGLITGDYVAIDSESQGTRKIGANILSSTILDRLDGKTFASLATAQKTVLAAINELNTRIGNIIAPSGSPTLAELEDIRTNFLGEIFSNAGDSVRVSDMIASGYTYVSFSSKADWNGNQSSSAHMATASINVSQYKGGQICAMFNSYYDSDDIREGLALLLYGGDTSSPDTNAVDEGYPDYYFDIHQYTGNLAGKYRIGIIVNIPDTYAYDYLYIVYFPLATAYPGEVSNIITPEFIAYGRKDGSISATDPDSDGNIIIS